MQRKLYKKEERGLKGGPNYQVSEMTGSVTTTGYWPDSPDRNNDFNIIPSNEITMQGMDIPLMGIDNLGNMQHMMPGQDYTFPGNYVTEIPMAKQGGIFLGAYKQVGGQLVPHDISVPNLSRQNGGSTMDAINKLFGNVEEETEEPTTGFITDAFNKIREVQKQTNQGYRPSEAYIQELMRQENEGNAGLKDNKYYPYPSVEGGTPTIGYGHKLTDDEVKSNKYGSGLTKEQVMQLMREDLNKHAGIAKSSFDTKFGEGAFSKLNPELQDLVLDYSYTGTGVDKFPNFHKAVYEYATGKNPAEKAAARVKMASQYKRYTGKNELKKRNEYTRNVLNNLKQEGGENEMPFGLPLKEQNIYTLPEYIQPINPKTGEILPDPRRPDLGMGTKASEFKYTYGTDEGDIDIPSIVAGQYIGDQALDRYRLTGERFKTMTDPGSYSNFYMQMRDLGLMQEKHGGAVKKVKIKSIPKNWKSQ